MSSKSNNPLNLPTEDNVVDDEPELNQKSISSHSIWLLVACVIALIIILVVDYFVRSGYKKKENELKELTDKFTELEQENENLQSDIERLQVDNKNYVNHINRLADELEARIQPKNPYSPLTPMTENSFDAPDPNATASKPQVVKDKEQLRAMVNSKRQTVQDVIDQQQAEKATKSDNSDANATQEIKNLTHADENKEDDDNNDSEVDADDKNVNDLMNIIQNQ